MTTMFFWFAMLLGLEQGPPTHFLDLRNAPRSTEEEYFAIEMKERLQVALASHGPHDAPPPAVPFEVTGIEFDKTTYDIGESFQCRLTVRYIGAHPVRFPVATQTHLFRKGMPGAHAAVISIQLDADPSLGTQIVLVERLYGSDSIAGSLVTLASGQFIEILTSGAWFLHNQTPLLDGAVWPVTSTPRIGLSWWDSVTPYKIAYSVNNPSITLNKVP